MMVAAIAAMSASAAESKGEALFKANCASCHNLTQPEDESKMVAPLAQGVMFHLAEAFKSEEEIKKHIQTFVVDPSEEKAICRSVRRFGVMPSLKGAVSAEDLKVISEWMVTHLATDKDAHEKMEQGMHKGQGKHRGQGMHRGQGKHRGEGMHRGQGRHRGEGKHRGRGNCQANEN